MNNLNIFQNKLNNLIRDYKKMLKILIHWVMLWKLFKLFAKNKLIFKWNSSLYLKCIFCQNNMFLEWSVIKMNQIKENNYTLIGLN